MNRPILFVIPLLVATACGGSDNKPVNTVTTPPPTATGPATAPPPTSTAPPPTATATTPPPANTGDPNLAAAASAALTPYATTEAPGMTKDGNALAGQIAEGGQQESAFQFVPGKCYTVLAAGAGVTQIEIEIQYAIPLPGVPSPSVGKSAQKGPMASMGGKGNCIKPISPVAAPAKFIVRAIKGSGVFAAQLYSK